MESRTSVIHKSIPLLQVHKGHRFFPRQFKVATVCEYCSKLVPLLESGEVCEGKQLVKTSKSYDKNNLFKLSKSYGILSLYVYLCVVSLCAVCGYACHEVCYKKIHKKCEGKARSKPIPEYNPKVCPLTIAKCRVHNIRRFCVSLVKISFSYSLQRAISLGSH